MSNEIISLREFARRMGIGEKTIRDGIAYGKITKGVTTDEKGKPKIIYEIALQECEAIGLGYRSRLRNDTTPVIEQPKPKPPQQPTAPPDEEEVKEAIAGLNGETSLATAQRAEKIFKAQLAYMEVEERSGNLLRKDEVYSQLFNFGNELKNGLLSIPDRITDDLISLADNRNSFHKLLTESLSAELERLAKFNEQ